MAKDLSRHSLSERQLSQRTIRKMDKLRKDKESQLASECSFEPQTNTRKTSKLRKNLNESKGEDMRNMSQAGTELQNSRLMN